MSESPFENALNSLHNQPEQDRLVKILVVIRKAIEWPKSKENIIKLRDSGCLKEIVESLQQSNDSTLSLALSILGNCCMELESARDIVRRFNVLPNLQVLLTTHSTHDSIQGRIFRIIGNICHHCHTDRLSDSVLQRTPQIVDAIVQYLKGSASKDDTTASEATVNMGIRAIRELLNCNTVLLLVENHQVLNSLGMLLMKYTLKYTNGEKHENILNNVIRTLHEYSRYKYTESLLQLKSTDSGNSLICLTELIPLSPRRVVKMIMNFIKISHHKSDLPVPEICENLMKYLKILDANIDSSLFKEYLQCFCLLFEYPENREVIRNKDGVPLLIEILRQFKTPTEFSLRCCTLIFSTLIKCMYDELLVAVQIKCGIVDVLIEKLEWIVGSSKTLEYKHVARKRYQTNLDCSIPEKRSRFGVFVDVRRITRFIENEFLYPRTPSPVDSDQDMFGPGSPRQRLPSPSESFFSDVPRQSMSRSSSPSSSSEMSLVDFSSSANLSWCGGQNSLGDNSDWDSDDYSPVCSEMGEEDRITSNFGDTDLDPSFGDDLMFEDDEDCINNDEDVASNTCPESSLDHLKVSLCEEALKMLRWCSKISPPLQEMCSPELLVTLIRCSRPFNVQNTTKPIDIISDILDCREHLLPLMQTDVIPMVHDLTIMAHGNYCVSCRHLSRIGLLVLAKFSKLAESDVGRGDITHFFIRANANVKQKLVVVIPYIIRDTILLSNLMVNCSGLNILIGLMNEPGDLQQRSIRILCLMASRKLGIKSPANVRRRARKLSIDFQPYYVGVNCLNVVTFQLDDGSSVRADRNFLIRKSDYFDKLLSGEFRESHEDTVALRNVAHKSLTSLFSLLEFEIERTEILELDLDLVTLLDVILLADRYLLVDLCVSLTGCVEQFRISTETAPVIYRWALESGTNILRVETVAFALGAKVLDSERFSMFQDLFRLGYTEQLVDDIYNLLKRFLSMRTVFKPKDKICVI